MNVSEPRLGRTGFRRRAVRGRRHRIEESGNARTSARPERGEAAAVAPVSRRRQLEQRLPSRRTGYQNNIRRVDFGVTPRSPRCGRTAALPTQFSCGAPANQHAASTSLQSGFIRAGPSYAPGIDLIYDRRAQTTTLTSRRSKHSSTGLAVFSVRRAGSIIPVRTNRADMGRSRMRSSLQ